jgi:hypothetical protein
MGDIASLFFFAREGDTMRRNWQKARLLLSTALL